MVGTFKLYDTKICFHSENNERDNSTHYKLLDDVFKFMRTLGFKIEINPETLRDYPLIANDHFYGRKGELEFKSHRYPSGFDIEFYQNINTKNTNGGSFDFDKLIMMPYLIKLAFINETNKIIKFLETKNCSYKDDNIKFKDAEDRIKQSYIREWHHPQKEQFRLSDVDGQTSDSYNSEDRNKKTIHNGEIKYFRDYSKYLARGKVYHNINNMWWVIINDTEYRNMASFELFDLTDEDRKLKGKFKTIKKYMNPNNTEHENQRYMIRDNLFILNCKTGLFKANTDYGSYQYYWSPNDNYKEFLIGLNRGYFLDKMSYEKELMEVDIEKTIIDWKKKILEMRRDRWNYDKFDKDNARELWDFVDSELDDSMSSETLQRYMYDKCSDLDIEEPWYDFGVVDRYKDDVEKFYKLFCEFQEKLRKEIG